jgi:hypothetical protein
MRFINSSLLGVLLCILMACNGGQKSDASRTELARPAVSSPAEQSTSSIATATDSNDKPGVASAGEHALRSRGPQQAGISRREAVKISFTNAQPAEILQAGFERKIIRNADLVFVTKNAADGQRRVASIAETHGGFVVTSDSSLSQGSDSTDPNLVVKLTVRVPSGQFGSFMQAMREVGDRLTHEKISGSDVTEEFIDVEARIKAKKALEAQFLEIMKHSRSVEDALNVQIELSDVRGEIESLEGRRRFLENQSSLSTINITLQPSVAVVTTSPGGFLHDMKYAFGDGVDAAAAIVLTLVRLFLVSLPVVLLVMFPAGLALRLLIRRVRRARLERVVESTVG